MTKPTLGFSAEQLLQIAELEVDFSFQAVVIAGGLLAQIALESLACAGQL